VAAPPWTTAPARGVGETAAGVPAEGHTDRPQDGEQPIGLAGGWRDDVWQAFREDPTPTGSIAAHEFPHGQLDADQAHAPGEVGQVALIATMDGR
jgi:hypothetical protein